MADGVAELGALLAGLVPPGVVAGAVLAAGELPAPLGVALVAGAVAAAPVGLADGVGDGLAGAAVPTAPPPKVVPWPGLPWTTADSGLPAAPSTTVTAMTPPMNAAAMTAARPAQRGPGRGRPCRPGAARVVVAQRLSRQSRQLREHTDTDRLPRSHAGSVQPLCAPRSSTIVAVVVIEPGV